MSAFGVNSGRVTVPASVASSVTLPALPRPHPPNASFRLAQWVHTDLLPALRTGLDLASPSRGLALAFSTKGCLEGVLSDTDRLRAAALANRAAGGPHNSGGPPLQRAAGEAEAHAVELPGFSLLDTFFLSECDTAGSETTSLEPPPTLDEEAVSAATASLATLSPLRDLLSELATKTSLEASLAEAKLDRLRAALDAAGRRDQRPELEEAIETAQADLQAKLDGRDDALAALASTSGSCDEATNTLEALVAAHEEALASHARGQLQRIANTTASFAQYTFACMLLSGFVTSDEHIDAFSSFAVFLSGITSMHMYLADFEAHLAALKRERNEEPAAFALRARQLHDLARQTPRINLRDGDFITTFVAQLPRLHRAAVRNDLYRRTWTAADPPRSVGDVRVSVGDVLNFAEAFYDEATSTTATVAATAASSDVVSKDQFDNLVAIVAGLNDTVADLSRAVDALARGQQAGSGDSPSTGSAGGKQKCRRCRTAACDGWMTCASTNGNSRRWDNHSANEGRVRKRQNDGFTKLDPASQVVAAINHRIAVLEPFAVVDTAPPATPTGWRAPMRTDPGVVAAALYEEEEKRPIAIVAAQLGDTTVRVLVDSASDVSMVDPALVASLDLDLRQDRLRLGLQRPNLPGLTDAPLVGEFDVTDTFVLEFGPVGSAVTVPVAHALVGTVPAADILLGADVMSSHRLVPDIFSGTVAIGTPELGLVVDIIGKINTDLLYQSDVFLSHDDDPIALAALAAELDLEEYEWKALMGDAATAAGLNTIRRLARADPGVLARRGEQPRPWSKQRSVHIFMRPHWRPRLSKAHRVPKHLLPNLREAIESHVAAGVLEPATNPVQSSPCFLVARKGETRDQATRLVADFKSSGLNAGILPVQQRLPRIDDILADLGGANFFSTADLRAGYNALPIDDESRHLTTVTTPFGEYQYTKTVMGLINSSAWFQRAMEQMFRPLIDRGWAHVYQDDVTIYTATRDEHDTAVEMFFAICKEEAITLALEKTTFYATSVKLLGFVVSTDGVSADPAKTAALVNAPPPTNKKELVSWMASVRYLKTALNDIEKTLAPLAPLVRKGTRWRWTPACQAAFIAGKLALVSAPAMAYPRFDLPFHVTTDGSRLGLGATLYQIHEDGVRHNIAYWSRCLRGAPASYTPPEFEMAAVLGAASRWQYFLLGRRWYLHTDANSVKWIIRNAHSSSNRRLQRWVLLFQAFDVDVLHRAGKNNESDYISRHPVDTEWNEDTDLPSYHSVMASLVLDAHTTAEAATVPAKLEATLADCYVDAPPPDYTPPSFAVETTPVHVLVAAITAPPPEVPSVSSATTPTPAATVAATPAPPSSSSNRKSKRRRRGGKRKSRRRRQSAPSRTPPPVALPLQPRRRSATAPTTAAARRPSSIPGDYQRQRHRRL